jgi:hypothetical protein
VYGVERIGPAQEYLLSGNSSRIIAMVLFDRHPRPQHMVNLKWSIRRKYNPKLSATRDQHGVFSHHHVVSITDNARQNNDILSYLNLPSTSTLGRMTSLPFDLPWHLAIPRHFSVRYANVKDLFIGCAVSVGACVDKARVPVAMSPHYAFASGDCPDIYTQYFRLGFSTGRLPEDHTPGKFAQFRRVFSADKYPMCQDNKISSIIVRGNQIQDGAHRASLLLAADPLARVLVVDLDGNGGAHDMGAICDM